MKPKEKDPGLIEDLGSVAGLYRTVFWMMGKRLRYGPDWEERLGDETLRLYAHKDEGKQSLQSEVRPN
jgi:hypothetical protein